MEQKKRYIPLIFSEKQIVEVKEHSDPNMIDKATGDRVKIAKILLATADRRLGYEFGKDSHGIDRDSRGAYINIPENFIKKDASGNDRRYIYLDADREYFVHFSGKQTGELDKDSKPIYDNPENATIKANGLRNCFGLKDYKPKEPKKEEPKKEQASKKKKTKETSKKADVNKEPKQKQTKEKKEAVMER